MGIEKLEELNLRNLRNSGIKVEVWKMNAENTEKSKKLSRTQLQFNSNMKNI